MEFAQEIGVSGLITCCGRRIHVEDVDMFIAIIALHSTAGAWFPLYIAQYML